jgi:hypothetical protein
MKRAGMPEAAIDHHRHSCRAEDDVSVASKTRDRPLVDSEPKAHPVKFRAEQNFRGGACGALATHPLTDTRTGRSRSGHCSRPYRSPLRPFRDFLQLSWVM